MIDAFPLQWPHGRARTKARSDSRFKVSHSKAFEEMVSELDRFDVTHVVVSTNIPLRRDGTPYRDGLNELLEDPGVAIYFTRKKRQIALCCDTYRRPYENIRALGLAIKSLRDMDRHGAGQILDQAFEGLTALPAPGATDEADNRAWWVVLGCQPNASADEVRAAYKKQAREAGGASVELNAAKDAGLIAAGEAA
ncbi:hypothetical protein AN189_07470 [Loktanella sp. 3ANDIMAR09]|uniref:hypothetical protein n=1 Tax=Loktanella sp. 3ANDIMAR09 TaxID=1225657 RepID=UPI0006F79A04|nr:hypothetical protein [Loktanella sp. 3ANDIMAR09]KQI68728.1 hypothetical protein AN189_07470 [Loktanella sp. 3ANDIMAR09]